MDSVCVTIATYPFLLRNRREQIRILTGTEEATFSWIATNYLAGNLGVRLIGVNLVLMLDLLSRGRRFDSWSGCYQVVDSHPCK